MTPKATIARLTLRLRHFISHDVVVNSTVEFDQRRNGTRRHDRFLGVGSCKSSNSVHGLPSCEDEKFNLIAECGHEDWADATYPRVAYLPIDAIGPDDSYT